MSPPVEHESHFLRAAMERHLTAVKRLGEFMPGTSGTYFEGSPTNDQECFERWRELDATVKECRTALIRPEADERDDTGEGRFYIDCEFDGHGGPLLSIAMVAEDGISLHVTVTGQEVRDPWVAANVVPILDSHDADFDVECRPNQVGNWLRMMLDHAANPVIIADSPVDIGRFCAAVSTGEHGGWASSNYPRMMFEVHNLDCYPTDLPGAVQHNAWWDAMALRQKLRDSGRLPQGEDSRSETECEASQSGAEGNRPNTPGQPT